jgi:hypothetical protein
MLNNPLITKNMNPEQKAEFAELRGLMDSLKADMAAGKVTTSAEQQKRMQKIQQLTMRMMMSMAAAAPGAAAPGAAPAQGAPPAPGGSK